MKFETVHISSVSHCADCAAYNLQRSTKYKLITNNLGLLTNNLGTSFFWIFKLGNIAILSIHFPLSLPPPCAN